MKSSHFDKKGAARMVDISSKNITARKAIASGKVYMKPETLYMIRQGNNKKGDVLAIARIAGIMSCKKTSDLIPLCHPITIDSVDIQFKLCDTENSIEITASCKTSNKTGIEMEALTAVSVSGLTIYDMCKSVDKAMRIDAIQLVHKSGGKSGIYNKDD